MHRVAFKMKLFRGCESEYSKRHDEIWDELKVLLKNSGISDYSIFLDRSTGELFACLTIDDRKNLEKLANEDVMKKWWSYMKDVMETNLDNSPATVALEEVFYLR